MKLKSILYLLCFFELTACAQKPSEHPHCSNTLFDKTLSTMLNFSVPTISVKELHEHPKTYILLDAREPKEFEVSHIEGAQNVGYDHFVLKNVEKIKKDAPIVVYCSIGYRSEKIGEQLKAVGFTNVKNLYGSIFEWVNMGYPLVDNQQKSIKKVHTFNYLWSKWVKNNTFEKIY